MSIFIGECDKLGNRPLYDTIFFEVKKDLSGATVTKGIMGFEANSKITSSKLFSRSQDFL